MCVCVLLSKTQTIGPLVWEAKANALASSMVLRWTYQNVWTVEYARGVSNIPIITKSNMGLWKLWNVTCICVFIIQINIIPNKCFKCTTHCHTLHFKITFAGIYNHMIICTTCVCKGIFFVYMSCMCKNYLRYVHKPPHMLVLLELSGLPTEMYDMWCPLVMICSDVWWWYVRLCDEVWWWDLMMICDYDMQWCYVMLCGDDMW